ncbi:endonuclease [Emticicia sp. CRIBPO]|uniref:endonuclease n=1 Tax=Emticicia sp. CRIBPO TaxID=2683258 RepID=UPI00141325A4|nr:endonuclease [Emticicia sp. CRIBPO]NBA84986.1 endonuclease [Emticicia sp. CRIBPO]
MAKINRYSQIIEAIFLKSYRKGVTEIVFSREEIEITATELQIKLPKNIGDILYSFRYRTELPVSILETAGKEFEWIIRPAGRALYKLVLTKQTFFKPTEHFAITKIPDATPGIIAKYAMTDEQALLAKVRYNRLLDIFTGLTCYSLQNHLRTTVPEMGQVETDEIYVGIDKRGVHYVIPVQAKGKSDKLGVVQIEQDFAIGTNKFPNLICKPIAAQFMTNGDIALFEFEMGDNEIAISAEKHYRLVSHDELTFEELEKYKSRVN